MRTNTTKNHNLPSAPFRKNRHNSPRPLPLPHPRDALKKVVVFVVSVVASVVGSPKTGPGIKCGDAGHCHGGVYADATECGAYSAIVAASGCGAFARFVVG